MDLEVGKEYYLEWQEAHPTGLKWDVDAFEVLRIDRNFPLESLDPSGALDLAEDVYLEVAVVRVFAEVDLGMNGFGDAEEPVEVKKADEILSLVRVSSGKWFGTWWAVELEISEFVERTQEDWIQLKRDEVARARNLVAGA